jgi:branched-chain amino acid transport system substrate-binding protein
LNNAKTRYLKLLNPSKKLYKIAVPCQVGDETGQHILLGVALKQQLLLNDCSASVNNNNISKESESTIYLEVVVADDKNDSGIAKMVAQKLVNIENIFAIVGHYSTEATQSALKTYYDSGLAVVSPTASGSKISEKYSTVFNRTVSSTEVEAESWLNFPKVDSLLKDQKTKIKIFYKKDRLKTTAKGFSQDLFDLFTKKLEDKYAKKLDNKNDVFELPIFDVDNLDKFNEKLNQLINGIKDDKFLIVLIPNGKNIENGVFERSLSVLDELIKKKENIQFIIGSNPLFSADNVELNGLNELNRLIN